MNSQWSEQSVGKPYGYYIPPRSSHDENLIPNSDSVEDKPFFASNIKYYPHLKPNGLKWVPDYLTYKDLVEAMDNGLNPKQLCPADVDWSKFKSHGYTLLDWAKYTQTQGQPAMQENVRLPNAQHTGLPGGQPVGLPVGLPVGDENSITWPEADQKQYAWGLP